MTASKIHCTYFTDERLPIIVCPESEVKFVDAEATDTTETVTAVNATAAGDKHIVANYTSPDAFTLSKAHLYEVINLTQEATDDQGLTAVFHSSTHQTAALKYECTEGHEFNNSFFGTYVPDCIIPCPSGYYKNNSSCELCPKGTYNNQSSQVSCVNCPAGTYTYSEGSVSVDMCYAECPPGLVSESRLPPCKACPPLKYQQDVSTCVNCSAKSNYTRGPQGGADSTACKAECAPGNFSYDGREPCRPCPTGYYQDQEGQTDCTACSGNSTAQEGSTSSDNCTATTRSEVVDPDYRVITRHDCI
ncbi:hypothetical protein LSAT2_015885 [Lamellibrachia satsuma]|nr:hypothetical protein LSAT2_015885 [Lamellibrachia satsuma]